MNLFEDNKDKFQEIIDFYYGMKEYGHIFEGHRIEEVEPAFDKIFEGIEKLNEILKDNWDI